MTLKATIMQSGKSTVEVQRLRTLATEIFKTINNLNPKFRKDIFKLKSNAKIRLFDIIVNTYKIT